VLAGLRREGVKSGNNSVTDADEGSEASSFSFGMLANMVWIVLY